MTSRPWLSAGSAAIALAVGLSGCQNNKARVARPPENLVVRDVPAPLRGTLGSMVTFERTDTVLVSGFGLMVGLNGTGGGPYQESIAGSMEQELARQGVSRAGSTFAGTPFEGLSPREVLESKDVAIVLVQAAVSPGAPEGSRFDVLVRSLPQAGATSLEGGTLYTTDLRLGPATVQGGPQARILGKANGPIFINPFSEPGREANGVTRIAGRILGGGRVTEPLKILMVLDNASPSRARQMVSTINSRFPQGNEPDKTARGRDERIIELRIPADYQDRPGDFLRVVQGLQLEQSYPDEYARRYADDMVREPALAAQLSFCLEAIGEPSKKFLYPLYDHAEIVPRMAALRAGAALGDIRAVPALSDLAMEGPPGVRAQAIEMLASLDAGPRVDDVLIALLGEAELDVRAAAMEGLTSRAEMAEMARVMRRLSEEPGMSYAVAERLARETVKGRLTGDTIQGIRRQSIGADPQNPKFILDLVPEGEPLIYITQSGLPRIVLFGSNLKLRRPMSVVAWSDRLLMAADTESDSIRVRYEHLPRKLPGRGGEVPGRVISAQLGDDLVDMIRFMAHQPGELDARPGLGLGYSEIVGALLEIQQQGGLDASIATERDRLMAELLKAAQGTQPPDRPETDRPLENPINIEPGAPKIEPEDVSPPVDAGGSLVVPLRPRPAEPGGRAR